MKDNFLDNPLTDVPVMEHVLMLHDRSDWKDIDLFMGREYLCPWLDYKAKYLKKETV